MVEDKLVATTIIKRKQFLKKTMIQAFCVLIVAQIMALITSWSFDEFYAVGDGMDPRGLLGLLTFVLYAVGTVLTVNGGLKINEYYKEKGKENTINLIPLTFGTISILVMVLYYLFVKASYFVDWVWYIHRLIYIPLVFYALSLAVAGAHLGFKNNTQERSKTLKIGALISAIAILCCIVFVILTLFEWQ